MDNLAAGVDNPALHRAAGADSLVLHQVVGADILVLPLAAGVDSLALHREDFPEEDRLNLEDILEEAVEGSWGRSFGSGVGTLASGLLDLDIPALQVDSDPDIPQEDSVPDTLDLDIPALGFVLDIPVPDIQAVAVALGMHFHQPGIQIPGLDSYYSDPQILLDEP